MKQLLLIALALTSPGAFAQGEQEDKAQAQRHAFVTFCQEGVALGIATLVKMQRIPVDRLVQKRRLYSLECDKVGDDFIAGLFETRVSGARAQAVGAEFAAKGYGLSAEEIGDEFKTAFEVVIRIRGSSNVDTQDQILARLETEYKAPKGPAALRALEGNPDAAGRLVDLCAAGMEVGFFAAGLPAPGATDREYHRKTCGAYFEQAAQRQQFESMFKQGSSRERAACDMGVQSVFKAVKLPMTGDAADQAGNACHSVVSPAMALFDPPSAAR